MDEIVVTVSSTFAESSSSQDLTAGGNAVTHDSRGNMTKDEQRSPTNAAKSFVWDVNGMLKQAVIPANMPTGIEGNQTYKYDALGRRTVKAAQISGANVTTVYVHDGQTVVAEYLSGGLPTVPQRKYVNASYVDEPVLLIDRTPAGTLGAGVDERFYYHRNQQYSITALCDITPATLTDTYAA